jgi:DNA polymerase III sliding clamp (beta) subunit (PCNA family)
MGAVGPVLFLGGDGTGPYALGDNTLPGYVLWCRFVGIKLYLQHPPMKGFTVVKQTFKVDAAELSAATAWIGKAIKNGRIPILDTMRVDVVAGGLRLRRTDYDLFLEATVSVEGAGDGGGQPTIQVSPVALAALLKGVKGDALVSIDTGGEYTREAPDALSVQTGGRTVTVPGAADPADFPGWPVFEPTSPPAVLDVPTLKRALTSVGTDDTRPALTGVRFEDDGGMVTTDRFRMSQIVHGGQGFTALVPSDALRLFTTGVAKGTVTVEYGKLASMDNPGANEARVRGGGGPAQRDRPGA